MKKSIVLGLFSVVLASQLGADTQVVWKSTKSGFQDDISIGAQLGGIAGIGLGGHVKYKIDEQFGVRAGFDLFSVSDVEIEDDDVTYNFDAKVQDLNLLIDWHPWEGSFRTSAGLVVNSSDLDGDITPTATKGETIKFTFDGKNYEYKLDELGAINTTADFDPIAPYIGIGWDTSFNKDKGFGFTFDIGAVFTGSMKTAYSLKYGPALDVDKATANLTGQAKESAKKEILAKQKEIKDELSKELDKEMIALQDELDKYEILPYVSIGFNYKF